MPKVIEIVPNHDSQGVALAAPKLRVQFEGTMDRNSVQGAVSLAGHDGPLFFHWERADSTASSVRTGDSRRPTAARRRPDFRPSADTRPTPADRPMGGRPLPGSAVTGPRVPLLAPHDILHIALGDASFDDFHWYELIIDGALAKDEAGNPLGESVRSRFRTRSRGVTRKPSDAKPGQSRGRRPGKYTRALVLGGGGSKGAFQAGAVQRLYQDEGFFPDVITAISVGSVNGAKLAEARTEQEHLAAANEIVELWRALHSADQVHTVRKSAQPIEPLLSGAGISVGGGSINEQVGLFTGGSYLAHNILPGIGNLIFGTFAVDKIQEEIKAAVDELALALSSKSVYTIEPLRKLLDERLDLSRIKEPNLELEIGAVDITSGRTHYFTHADITASKSRLLDCIAASSGMPVFYPPVEIDGGVFVDGGVTDVAAVHRALLLGATDIVVVSNGNVTSNPTTPLWTDGSRYHGIFEMLLHSILGISFSEIARNDIDIHVERARLLNEFKEREIRIRVIDQELDLYDALTFSKTGIARAIDYGAARTRQMLDKSDVQPAPHPVKLTNTAAAIVVRPVVSDGRLIRMMPGLVDVTISLFDGKPTLGMPGEANNLINTFPSDAMPTLSTATVAGPFAVPSGEKFYAIPLHPSSAGSELSVLVHVSLNGKVMGFNNPTAMGSVKIDGGPVGFVDSETVTWTLGDQSGSGVITHIESDGLRLNTLVGIFPIAPLTIRGETSGATGVSQGYSDATIAGGLNTNPGPVNVKLSALGQAAFTANVGPDGTQSVDVPFAIPPAVFPVFGLV